MAASVTRASKVAFQASGEEPVEHRREQHGVEVAGVDHPGLLDAVGRPGGRGQDPHGARAVVAGPGAEDGLGVDREL